MKDSPWYGPDSTGASLLEVIKRLPQWAGDDADACLEVVIRSRSQTRFFDAPQAYAEEEGTRMAATAQRQIRRPHATTDEQPAIEKPQNGTSESTPPHLRQSTVGDLLKFAGTWEGDDLEECLEVVYASRSQVSA